MHPEEDTSTDNVETKDSFHFPLEEFRQLRAEILLHVRGETQMQILTVVAVAFVFWFLATNERVLGERPEARLLIWWIPMLIVFAGWFMSRSFGRRCQQLGRYLKTVEKRLAFNGEGWEHYSSNESNPWTGLSRYLFWSVLTFLTILSSALFSQPGILARFMP